MAVPSSPVPKASKSEDKKNGTQKEESKKQTKRSKDPGIRVVGGRIYDSQNGKTCHQCRQKTMDFTAGCTNFKRDKQCTIKFCHKCLLNRYGENAEEMEARGDWHCPKCRDICNCSFCMKKKGHKPTGILVHAAKATGFNSVSELLHVKGSDVSQDLIVKTKTENPKKSVALTEGPAAVSLKKRGKDNSIDGDCNGNLHSTTPPSSPKCSKAKKVKREKGVVEVKKEIEIAKSNGVCSPKKSTEDSEIVLRRSPRKFNKSDEVTKKENVNDDKNDLRRSPRKFNAPKEATITDEKTDKKFEKENKKAKKTQVQAESKVKPSKRKKDTYVDHIVVDVVLPQGSVLTKVAGYGLLPHDAGYAMQFLEFCSAFGEVLNIRKGQPDSVLRDILNPRSRRGKLSSAVQFIIQLVSFILKDIEEEEEEEEQEESLSSPSNGNDSWVKSLKRCLAESDLELEDFPEHCLDKGSDGYEMLEPSQKLRLLNFLCDESLCTKEMRSWIEEQNLKFVEKEKDTKEISNAAKEKEKKKKQKLQEEIVKAIIAKDGAPLTISEHDAIISRIKKETNLARLELLEAKEKRLRSDAVRTDPIFVDDNGHAFWKLKCYDDSILLLQEIGGPENVDYKDKWFSFNDEEMKVVENYVSSARYKRIKLTRNTKMKDNSDFEVDSSSNGDSPPATTNV